MKRLEQILPYPMHLLILIPQLANLCPPRLSTIHMQMKTYHKKMLENFSTSESQSKWR